MAEPGTWSRVAEEPADPRERVVRRVLVWVYVLGALSLFYPWSRDVGWRAPLTGPRIFWTMLLPLVPAVLVLIGYHRWRRICPLAALGGLGRLWNRAVRPRRVPAWMETWFPLISLAFLTFGLSFRLVSINGDGPALGGFLVILALLAALTNMRFTGKSWCNFLCPIGIVERIYTEPVSLPADENSQCGTCTACKRQCPDIDLENSYWKDVSAGPKQAAYFMFPGLVLGFYVYYWLRAGTWDAYYSGAWTRPQARAELMSGAGWFFADGVPAYLAAPLSLLGFMLVSLGLFTGLRAALGRLAGPDADVDHQTQTLAGFVAFNLFYLFAGAPTLAELPWAPRVVGFVIPVLSTVVLVRRWGRRSQDRLEAKAAAKLKKKWSFEDPPPDEPAALFAYVRAREAARDLQLAAYRDSLAEALSGGPPGPAEQRLLARLRDQLEVSEKEHRRIATELAGSEEGFREAVSVERALQLSGYREALTEALLRDAGEAELLALRYEFAVDDEDHGRVLAEIQGEASSVRPRLRTARARLVEVDGDLEALVASEPAGAFDLAVFVLECHRRRVQELVAHLAALCPNDSGSPDLEGAAPDLDEALERLLTHPDPLLRAATLQGMSLRPEGIPAAALARARADPVAVVREVVSDQGPVSRGPPRRVEGHTLPPLPGQGEVPRSLDAMLCLRCVPLFDSLEPEELHALARHATHRYLDPGAALVREGEESDELFVLLEGEVHVEPGGQEVARLGPGEVFGELAAIDQNPRSADLRAGADGAVLLSLPGAVFRRQLRRGELAPTLLATLAGRLRDTLARLASP